jgi:hypothetical protein
MTLDNDETATAIEQGLDFILTHLPEPTAEHTISTYATQGRQISKNRDGRYLRKREILAYYKASSYLDCRISAYPIYTDEYIKKTGIAPRLLLADVDKLLFKSNELFEKTVRKTLQNFKEMVDSAPTMVWSGGGYHFMQPIDAIVLEKAKEFEKFQQPSRRFMQFLEWLLTVGKADANHYRTVSFKNCMLRVPGSFNSKYVDFDHSGKIVYPINSESEVRVIRKWNGKAMQLKSQLLTQYYIWLQDQEIKKIKSRRKAEYLFRKYGHSRLKRPIFYQRRSRYHY